MTTTTTSFCMMSPIFQPNTVTEHTQMNDDMHAAKVYLRDLKARISSQSKRNFFLEQNVRFLDSRIALLIQNQMHATNISDMEKHDYDLEPTFPCSTPLETSKCTLYGTLFYLLQQDPKYIATLSQHISMTEMDALVETVMFTLYANQYDMREEYLLLSMFEHVLKTHFDQTKDFKSVLRANTPLSRMITTYTRRGPGQAYLKSVLSEVLCQLISDKDMNLEIHPLKIHAQIHATCMSPIDFDQAVQHPDIAALVQVRASKLAQIASDLISRIVNSLPTVPYGIRWICKQIKGLAKRKFPNVSDKDVNAVMASFFFLRFVNPAIVSPQAYMLVPSHPATHPRRSLTLLAKLIQKSVANPCSMDKELRPFHSWYKENASRIQTFLSNVPNVCDFFHTLELEQYRALTQPDPVLTMHVNEVYSMHALVIKHRLVLCARGSVFDSIVRQLGPSAPDLVPRSMAGTYQLTLLKPVHTSVDALRPSSTLSLSSDKEVLYMQAKYAFVDLFRKCPHLCNNNLGSLNLLKVLSTVQQTYRSDPVLSQMTERAGLMLQQLEGMQVINGSDQYAILVEEIIAEMSTGSSSDRMASDTQTLEQVFQTIYEHNEFLKTQILSYKAYLANIQS